MPRINARHLLPDEDSNPNIQSQNLSYYHYTIRQSEISFRGARYVIIVLEFSLLRLLAAR